VDATPLDALLDRVPSLTVEQVRVLHATWEGGDVEVRTAAWRRGKALLAAQGLDGAYREASEVVRRWMSDFATGRTALPYELDQSFGDVNRLELRIAAAPALLDAILGTLVGDDLDEAERDELLAPWLEATDRPAPVTDEWERLDNPG
jgi:hypothetical protein